MTPSQLIAALAARKARTEALLYVTTGDAYAAAWSAFQVACRRYWRAVVWLGAAR